MFRVDRKLEFGPVGTLGWYMRNNSGSTVNAGNVVILDTTDATGNSFTTSTTADDPLVLGVSVDRVTNGKNGFIAMQGLVTGVTVNGITDIAAGNALSTYTAAGIAQKATSAKAGVFGIALQGYTTDDSNGTINVFLMPSAKMDSSATVSYGTGGQMAADGVAASNSAGSTNAVARIDHAHTNTADTPAIVYSTSNSAGTAGKVLASDATIAIFDTTNPTAATPSQSAAVGTAAFTARRDHQHNTASAAPVDGSLTSANAAGTSTSFSAADHAHKAILKNDINLILGTTDAAATATNIQYDTAETVDATKIGVDETSRRIILCDYGDMGSDTTLAAATNAELVFMNAAFTKWFKISGATAGGVLDVITGNNLTVNIAGTTAYTFDTTNFTLASGKLLKFAGNDSIVDSNGNQIFTVSATASATNEFTVVNAANSANAYAGPAIQVSGDGANSTNISLLLSPKGTGGVRLINVAGTASPALLDYNGNTLVDWSPTASAVDNLRVTNAATANPASVLLSAVGTDTNINIKIVAKGTGGLIFPDGTAANPGLVAASEGGQDTGLYYVGANTLGVATGGAAIATFDTTGLEITGGKQILSTTATPIGISVLNTSYTVGTLGTLVAPTKAGSPADADSGNINGALNTDSTNNKIWARVGAVWKGVAIAGFSIPKNGNSTAYLGPKVEDNFDETKCPLCTRDMKPGQAFALIGDRYYTNGDEGLHAYAAHLKCAMSYEEEHSLGSALAI